MCCIIMYFSLHIILMLLKSSLIIPIGRLFKNVSKIKTKSPIDYSNTKMFSIMLKGFITEINYFNCFHLNYL